MFLPEVLLPSPSASQHACGPSEEVGVLFFGGVRDGDEFMAGEEYDALSDLRSRMRPAGGRYQVRLEHAESTLLLRKHELIERLAGCKVRGLQSWSGLPPPPQSVGCLPRELSVAATAAARAHCPWLLACPG